LADQAEQVWILKEFKMLNIRHLQLRLYALTDPVEGEFNFYIVVWNVTENSRLHDSVQVFKTKDRARVRFDTYQVFNVN
jgi:hypothetical protein